MAAEKFRNKATASDASGLPGLSGLFNPINSNLYHYAGNNPVRYTDPDGREDEANELANLGNDIFKLPESKSLELQGHLLRSPDSYKTTNGQNKELRGKDLLIIENKTKGDSVQIPVSSVANMEGSGLADTLAEKDFVLSYDPEANSKYAPLVFTISDGELFSESLLSATGEKINSNGTTETNNIPWRGHNTKYWGSQGCIVGQTGNPKGDYSTVVNKLNSWGVKGKCDIPCSFGIGAY